MPDLDSVDRLIPRAGVCTALMVSPAAQLESDAIVEHDGLNDCDCQICVGIRNGAGDPVDVVAVKFVLDSIIDFLEELKLSGESLRHAGQLLRDVEALRGSL